MCKEEGVIQRSELLVCRCVMSECNLFGVFSKGYGRGAIWFGGFCKFKLVDYIMV